MGELGLGDGKAEHPRPPPPVLNSSPGDLRLLGNESHLGSICTMCMPVPGRRGKGKMNRVTLPVQKYLHPVDRQTGTQKGTSPSERMRATGKPFN